MTILFVVIIKAFGLELSWTLSEEFLSRCEKIRLSSPFTHRELNRWRHWWNQTFPMKATLLGPIKNPLDENFWKCYLIFKKFRSRSFTWVVKHFSRNTKNWFFSSLKMVIFCQIANSLILQDQGENWLFSDSSKTYLQIF